MSMENSKNKKTSFSQDNEPQTCMYVRLYAESDSYLCQYKISLFSSLSKIKRHTTFIKYNSNFQISHLKVQRQCGPHSQPLIPQHTHNLCMYI